MAKYTDYHKTFVHQDFKYDDPKRKPLVVECSGCDFIANGIHRRPEAKEIGRRHEDEMKHA
jgi:hypothetical protein